MAAYVLRKKRENLHTHTRSVAHAPRERSGNLPNELEWMDRATESWRVDTAENFV